MGPHLCKRAASRNPLCIRKNRGKNVYMLEIGAVRICTNLKFERRRMNRHGLRIFFLYSV